jgi:glycosyltransferase involved in cell wall biosynthesis
MFESEGHRRALARSLLPRRWRRGTFVVVSCWLGELTRAAPAPKRLLYRQAYRGVDLVTVFSANQRAILRDRLGIDDRRIAVVPFGIDIDELDGVTPTDDATVVAVGRDRGRDWPTLLAAARNSGWRVKLATRQRQLDGLSIPPEVEVLGSISRQQYVRTLAGARVVVIITHDLAYPTGQSVMLEAMALGKACVVTATAAMSDYIEPGVTCLAVDVGDADGVRRAIERLLADPVLRETLGHAARQRVVQNFTARTMWSAVAAAITTLPTGN